MNEHDNIADELEALIQGGYNPTSDEADKEDTDLSDDEVVDTETNDTPAEDDQDTDDTIEEDEGENTPVDDDDLDESDDDDVDDEGDEDDVVDGDEPEDDDVDGADEDIDGESETDEEDDTDTEQEADVADGETTDDVDYQKQYEELLTNSKEALDFYDKVAGAKFKANGKEVEGFKDPEKLIQAQQLAYNYSAKMAGFKQYRPFMQPLKERGLLENPEKFDMIMDIVDGNTDALKKYIQDSGIDPLE